MKLHLTKQLLTAILTCGCVAVTSQALASEEHTISETVSISDTNLNTYDDGGNIQVTSSGTLILCGTGDTSRTKNYTSLGDIIVEKSGILQTNSKNDTVVLASTITKKGGTEGEDVLVSITKKDGADSYELSNFHLSTTGNAAAITAVSLKGTYKTFGVQNADVSVTGHLYIQKSMTYTDSLVTVKKGGTLETAAYANLDTFSGTTLALATGDSDTVQATLKTRESSESAMTAKGYKFTSDSDGKAHILGNGNNTAQLTNVDLDITGTLYLDKVTFTNSVVTVHSDAELKSEGTGTKVTFDTLVIEAGGSLTNEQDANSFILNGDTTLNLNTLTQTATQGEFTTNALKAQMTDSAVLTLVLTDDLLGADGALYGLDTFSITFNNLSAAEGYTLSNANFDYNVEGWDVTVADPGATGLKLTFTSNKAVPEPTTATLSLLALAGLAARRRRK